MQAALDYQTEKLRIYEEKYTEETGKDRPELTDDERRRLAKRGRGGNQDLLDTFLSTDAISQAQRDESLGCLIEKMGIKDDQK